MMLQQSLLGNAIYYALARWRKPTTFVSHDDVFALFTAALAVHGRRPSGTSQAG
jgi:hypothetical protein